MTAKVQYEKEIITSEDYNISLSEFVNWLKDNNKEADFRKSLKEGLYETAVDFSIPVIIVKYLEKNA